MNECKQRIAIAEACGITGIRRVDEDPSCHDPGVLIDGSKTNVPNYLHDLNAMHEVEMHIFGNPDYQIVIDYCDNLEEVCSDSNFSKLTASASQRAEAFLRTIRKWEEKE